MTDESDNSRETRVVMVEAPSGSTDDGIGLIDLIRLFIEAWKLILGVAVLVTGMALAHALLAPEIYKAQTLLAPVEKEKTRLSSTLSQFGSLAAMAGISNAPDVNKEQVIATLMSRKFLQHYIEDQNLLPVLFEEQWDKAEGVWKTELEEDLPTNEKAYLAFSKSMNVTEDLKTGLITLSIYWKDPQVAAEWANDLVGRLNEELRSKAIEGSRKRIGYINKEISKTMVTDMKRVLYSLLESEEQKAMLANVNEEFALAVIDPAQPPEFREKPNRKLIVFSGGICGFLLGIFAVLLRQFLRKLRSPIPPESSA